MQPDLSSTVDLQDLMPAVRASSDSQGAKSPKPSSVAEVTPWPRFGHVSWVHKGHMYVFGSRSSTLPDSSACKAYKKMYLNDLWALDTSSYHWTQIRATGITPSPRADMGQSLH